MKSFVQNCMMWNRKPQIWLGCYGTDSLCSSKKNKMWYMWWYKCSLAVVMMGENSENFDKHWKCLLQYKYECWISWCPIESYQKNRLVGDGTILFFACLKKIAETKRDVIGTQRLSTIYIKLRRSRRHWKKKTNASNVERLVFYKVQLHVHHWTCHQGL